MNITDPEVRILAGISAALEADSTSGDSEWNGSLFAWIICRLSRQAGARGDKLVAGWLAERVSMYADQKARVLIG